MIVSFVNERASLPREYSSMISDYMHRTKGKLITIDYRAVIPTRSLLQNRYYWGVIIKLIAEELGYSPEVCHDHLKKLFLGFKAYDFPDGTTNNYWVSTTDLTTVEFENYCSAIRKWANDFLMMIIPLPNESPFNYYKYEV